MKCTKLLAALLACLMLSACSMIPIDKLIDRPDPTAVPQLPTAAPILTPPQTQLRGSMEVESEKGTRLVLEDPVLGDMLMQAAQNPSLRVDNASCPFTHKVWICDGNGDVMAEYRLANDGCLTAQDEEGQVFLVPQYVWSTIDTALWAQLDALWNEPWIWNADGDSTAALEIRLPYLLNTVLAQRIGYMDGYFSSYRIYEIRRDDHQVYVYLLAVQQACAVQGESFRTLYEQALPVRLTLDELKDGSWRLSGYKQADFSDGVQKQAVRSVFSYENTALAMEDLADLSPWLEPMKMQIRSFMLSHGMGHLQWES